MQNRNFQNELDKKIEQLAREEKVPTLLLHSCCAPCSSYCLEYLSQYFSITIFYYNPNITEQEEYKLRVEEQKRLLKAMDTKYPVFFMEGEYVPEQFFQAAKGLEDAPEGGARCIKCFYLRLMESARVAAKEGFDYFTTTLTISPLKNAGALNAIGQEAGKKYGVEFLPSDFKKKNGYKRSIELSREHDLYRQTYCGCVFSKEANAKLSQTHLERQEM